jgi:hypothetical protein
MRHTYIHTPRHASYAVVASQRGEGHNCLLNAASLGLWGVQDRDLRKCQPFQSAKLCMSVYVPWSAFLSIQDIVYGLGQRDSRLCSDGPVLLLLLAVLRCAVCDTMMGSTSGSHLRYGSVCVCVCVCRVCVGIYAPRVCVFMCVPMCVVGVYPCVCVCVCMHVCIQCTVGLFFDARHKSLPPSLSLSLFLFLSLCMCACIHVRTSCAYVCVFIVCMMGILRMYDGYITTCIYSVSAANKCSFACAFAGKTVKKKNISC